MSCRKKGGKRMGEKKKLKMGIFGKSEKEKKNCEAEMSVLVKAECIQSCTEKPSTIPLIEDFPLSLLAFLYYP